MKIRNILINQFYMKAIYLNPGSAMEANLSLAVSLGTKVSTKIRENMRVDVNHHHKIRWRVKAMQDMGGSRFVLRFFLSLFPCNS